MPREERPSEELSLTQLLGHPALRLNEFEQECARLWVSGATETQISTQCLPEGLNEIKPSERRRLVAHTARRVRWALNRAAERVAIYRPIKDSGAEFSRVLVQCVRNRQEGNGAQDLIGLLPTIYLDDPELTVKEYQEIVTAPQNYRNVVLRSPAMHTGMARQSDRDALRHMSSGL